MIRLSILPLALAACLSGCAAVSPQVTVSAAAAGEAMVSAAAQVRRCYREPQVPSAAKRIVTHVRVRYGPDGVLIGEPWIVAQQGVNPANQAYAGRMAAAASLAVIRCSPLRLPAELYRGGWDAFDLTFAHALLA